MTAKTPDPNGFCWACPFYHPHGGCTASPSIACVPDDDPRNHPEGPQPEDRTISELDDDERARLWADLQEDLQPKPFVIPDAVARRINELADDAANAPEDPPPTAIDVWPAYWQDELDREPYHVGWTVTRQMGNTHVRVWSGLSYHAAKDAANREAHEYNGTVTIHMAWAD